MCDLIRGKDAGTAMAILMQTPKADVYKRQLLEAKEEILKNRSEYEKEEKSRRADLQRQENRLQQKEENLDRKTEALEKREESLAQKLSLIHIFITHDNGIAATARRVVRLADGHDDGRLGGDGPRNGCLLYTSRCV